MMYQGPTGGVVPWFSGHLGYGHDPALHGVTSDWVMDLVSVSFAKPKAGGPARGRWCAVCVPVAAAVHARALLASA
jgi:hypothetical protein